MTLARLDTEVVVVGAGVAGLSVALGLAGRRRVHLLSKTRLGDGGATPWAQGGIAAAVGPGDTPALHAADTLAVAGGLAERHVVDLLVTGGPAAIERLQALGARFDRDGSKLALHREAAHSRARIVHARDATGAEVLRALSGAARRASGIAVFEEHEACELLLRAGRVVGVLARTSRGELVAHVGAVVLATGGLGRVYAHTTNPREATGDALAMAARAGARLADLEFVQFHPTALEVGADPQPLLTEALRGQGATLVDETGRRFLQDVHADAELAPRDVVARAIFLHQKAGHRTLLDARQAIGGAFPTAFPTVFAACQAHGLDPRVEPVPVSPAAHYHMGGVWVDDCGRSSLCGLFACGEAARTGVHGANRLASNSLLEALVFGARLAEQIGSEAEDLPGAGPLLVPDELQEAARRNPGGSGVTRLVHAVRHLMWDSVGLVRDETGLSHALAEFERLRAGRTADRSEASTLLQVAQLVAAAALERRESRGSHFRSDHPQLAPAGTQPQVENPVLERVC